MAMSERNLTARLVEVLRYYAVLGFTSFGGPGVHVVILRQRFVEKLEWVDLTTFADLFALGNALPGPGSTQLAFAIAVVRNGVLAGFLAFLLWTLPGAGLMAGLAAGVSSFPEQLPAIVLALFSGLNASAVGLIAFAALQLSRVSVTDHLTRLIVLGSASFGICYHAPWMYPTLIGVGGSLTLAFDYRYKIWNAAAAKARSRRTALPRRSNEIAQNPPQDRTASLAGDIELEALPRTQPSEQSADIADKSPDGDPVQPPPPLQSAPAGLRNRAVQADRPDGVTNSAAGASSSAASVRSSTNGRTQVQQSAHLRVPSRNFAIMMGALFICLVVIPITVRAKLANPPRLLDFFTNLVIAGVTIFGGGPVVVPLLRGYTVDPACFASSIFLIALRQVSSRDFLLGYALLQAAPGPNFNFAVYLGILANPSNPVVGALVGWLGIFAPGILVKVALLPVYNSWRRNQVVRSILRGLNAAAAGLIYTAVWQLFLVGYIYVPATGAVPGATAASATGPLTSDPFWGVIVASAFVATESFNVPPAFTILGGACGGLAWYGVRTS